jgi:folate-binding protein YgfZ
VTATPERSPLTPSAACDHGDVGAEYAALRDGAGLLDRTGWAVVRISGADRLSFLHKYISQDVAGLEPGHSAYGCVLTIKGLLVSDLEVWATDDALLLLTPPAGAAPLQRHLGKYALLDDVSVARDDEQRLLSVWGARAAEVLERALGAGAPTAAWTHTLLDAGGVAVRASRSDRPGFDLLLAADQADRAIDLLTRAGAVLAGAAAVEQVRVEEGWPVLGRDMDERTIPVEAGLTARAISYEKGCYLGQETIVRIRDRGRVNRHLVGVLLGDQPLPALPAPVLAGEKEVGQLTSVARSPRLGQGLGLGLINRKHVEPGTELRLGASDGPLVTVCALPVPAPS